MSGERLLAMKRRLYGDVAEREYLGLISMELGSILDDALAYGVKIVDLAGPEIFENFSKPVNELGCLCFVVTIPCKLRYDLGI